MTTALVTENASNRAGPTVRRNASEEASRPVLKPLTSLRFFAALAVFFSHLGYLRNIASYRWLCSRIFVEGYAGVTFFFVLSGFILTYNYRNVLADLQADEIKKFYIARFARIYPLYLLTFLISLPLIRNEIVHQPLTFLWTAVIQVLAIQSYMPQHNDFIYNMPAWSLCDEFFFYALLPLILYGFAKLRLKTGKSLIALGVGLWLIASIFVALGRNLASAHWLFYITPPFRLFDFMIGIVCGLLFLKMRRLNLSPITWTFMEFASCAAILISVLLSSYYIHQSFRYGVYYMPAFSAATLVFAFQGGLISKLLSNTILVLLGEMSFAFYMFHQLVFRYLNELSRGKLGYSYYPMSATFLAFAITIGLSYASFTYYERFGRDLLRRLLKP